MFDQAFGIKIQLKIVLFLYFKYQMKSTPALDICSYRKKIKYLTMLKDDPNLSIHHIYILRFHSNTHLPNSQFPHFALICISNGLFSLINFSIQFLRSAYLQRKLCSNQWFGMLVVLFFSSSPIFHLYSNRCCRPGLDFFAH